VAAGGEAAGFAAGEPRAEHGDSMDGMRDEAFCWELGHAWRRPDRRFWYAFFTSQRNTHERDGPITFDGKAWRSQTDKAISYPSAVIDDFGELVPVRP
jgi:hypothetical protein